MTRNELIKNGTTGDGYLYSTSTIFNSPDVGSTTSITDLNYSNGTVTYSFPSNTVNNPFDPVTGQWRSLNLKVDAQNGYGTSDSGAILRFGFGSTNPSALLSAACGFTLGIPPLHARHISTVARCIAYGFAVNPVMPDSLFVQHGNELIRVSPPNLNTAIQNLSIQIFNGTVVYRAGETELLNRTILSLSPTLYVVGCLGFDTNRIINVRLSGGSSHSLQVPNYASELYIPCLGIGTDKTQVELKLKPSSTATITYPDNSQVTLSGTNSQPIPSNGFNQTIPFTLKIAISGGLGNLEGIKITDPLRGFNNIGIDHYSSTETSLSRPETRNALTGLEEIEIKASLSKTSRAHLYHIGEIPLPVPSSSVESKLKSAYVEGNFDATPVDFRKHQKLESLYLTKENVGTFNPASATRLKKIELVINSAKDLSQNSFINFRQFFHPDRNTSTHGILFHRRDRTLLRNIRSTGHQPFREIHNANELAIAAESARLLYGWKVESTKQNHLYVDLSLSPDTRFRSSVPSNQQLTNVRGSFGLFSAIEKFSENPDVLYGTGDRNRFIRYHYVTQFSDTRIIIRTPALANPADFDVLPGKPILIRTGNSTSTINNYIFKKVTAAEQTLEDVVLTNKLTESDQRTRTLQYKQYDLTLDNIRKPLTINNVTITDNSSNQPNTFVTTIPSNQIDNIFIGDTVWQGNGLTSTFTPLAKDEHPAMVIGKQGNTITLIQRENNKHPQITAGTGSLTFAYEFKKLENITFNNSFFTINNPYADVAEPPHEISVNDFASLNYLNLAHLLPSP